MRLIDADALIEEIREITAPLLTIPRSILLNRITYAPTIEAEPITTEKAVEYLMRTKWFQEHDTAMIEKGMERQKKLTEPRKHGHWIENNDSRIRGRCSACGWEPHLYEDDVYGMPYCPNCGAKMDEVEE